MEDADQSRLDRADGSQLAFSLVLRDLVVASFPDNAERIARRDLICAAIEAIYEDASVMRHAHAPFQIALAAIEEIYAPLLPDQPRADPSD
jgi:hypothetical protein